MSTVSRAQEVSLHCRGGRITIVGILGQCLHDDAIHGLGNISRNGRRERRNGLDMLVGHGHGRIARERRLSSEELEKQHARGVQIRTSINRLTLRLLGGEVLSCAHDRVGLRHGRLRIGDRASNAEVHDLDLTLGGQHDISGLDIAVHEASRMRVLECRQDAGNNVDDLGDRERTRIVGEEVLERTPIDVLHDDVGDRDLTTIGEQRCLFTRVVNGNDVGVVQRSSGLRFAAETRLEDGIHRQVSSQRLDSNDSRQALVEPEVYFGHASAPDKRAHLIASP